MATVVRMGWKKLEKLVICSLLSYCKNLLFKGFNMGILVFFIVSIKLVLELFDI